MTARFYVRRLWLAVRRRVLPWCMHRGCWNRSVPRFRGSGRGNVCPSCLWATIESFGDDGFDDENDADDIGVGS